MRWVVRTNGENMKRKIAIILISMITIINVTAASFIFFDIQVLQTPVATINIDVIEINSKEVIIETTIDISNQNAFELIAKNFEITMITPEGKKVGHAIIKGGNIPSNENKTFVTVAHVAFNGSSPKMLTSKITGVLGLCIGFIHKTIPLSVDIITSIEKVIEQVSPPSIQITADFSDITQERIRFKVSIDAYNPNTFNIHIRNISMTVETETGKKVGNLSIIGGIIPYKNSAEFAGNGKMLIEALNAKTLFINMSATAGAELAGVNESMNLSVETIVKVPDLSELIPPDSPIDLIIKPEYETSLTGLIGHLTLEIHNPTKLTLTAKDVTIYTYATSDNERQLISKCELEDSMVESENITYLIGEEIIPYSNLLTLSQGTLFPGEVLLLVRGNLTIPGINQSIWLGFGGYNDMHLFT
jgi:LEA14-like dessication related protein